MTEAEWLALTDLKPMLEFIRSRASERKLLLFCCACCRSIWQLIPDERSRSAVVTVERFADGRASREELKTAENAALEAEEESDANGAAAVSYLFQYMHTRTAQFVAEFAHTEFAAPETLSGLDRSTIDVRKDEERRRQTHILRDIFGPLLFWPVTADPSWFTSDVVALATGVYQDRAFDRLPILADALEDAGCDNPDILDHCRSDGPHVRGCWVVDLILGKT